MLLAGVACEVWSESRGDGGVVHRIMKRRRFHSHHPQLLRLLFSEAPRSEPRSGPVWLRIRFFLGSNHRVEEIFFLVWVNVVSVGRPAEERIPPVAVGGGGGGGNGGGGFQTAVFGDPVAGDGGSTNSGGLDGEEISRHCCSEMRWFDFWGLSSVYKSIFKGEGRSWRKRIRSCTRVSNKIKVRCLGEPVGVPMTLFWVTFFTGYLLFPYPDSCSYDGGLS